MRALVALGALACLAWTPRSASAQPAPQPAVSAVGLPASARGPVTAAPTAAAAAPTELAPIVVSAAATRDHELGAQLDRTLQVYAEAERRQRTVAALVTLGQAGLYAGIGLTLLAVGAPTYPNGSLFGITLLGAAGGVALLLPVTLLSRGTFERLAEDYRGSLRTESVARAVRLAESRWAEHARAGRSQRLVLSGIMFALGGVLSAAAVAVPLIFASLGTRPGPTSTAVNAITVLAGGGALICIGGGIATLLVDSVVEQRLRLWRAGHDRPLPAAAPGALLPGVWLSDTGGGLHLAGRF